LTSNKILEDIIIVIDTREQARKDKSDPDAVDRRVDCIEKWGILHGATVEHHKLDLCDVRVLGEFRGTPVDIGIEAKGLADFINSYGDLQDKLARAYNLYDHVGLFVEVGNYAFKVDDDGFHATLFTKIKNKYTKEWMEFSMPYVVYKNLLGSLANDGVYVRELRSEDAFPFDIAAMLINVVKPVHTGLDIAVTDYHSVDLNVYAKMPGCGYKTAAKLTESFKNLHWLASSSEVDIQNCVGSKRGTDIYNYIRHDRNSSYNPCHKDCRDITAYECKGVSCSAHPNYKISNDKSTEGFRIPPNFPSVPLFQSPGIKPTPEVKLDTPDIFQSSSAAKTIKVQETAHAKVQQLQGKDATLSKLGTLDNISNHPGSISNISLQNKLGDTQEATHPISTPPPDVQGKKSQKSSSMESQSSPAITCNKINEADDLFGKAHPDWVNEKKPGKMNLRRQLEIYLETPRLLQDCVDQYNEFAKGTVWEHIARMKKEGVLIQFNDGTLVRSKP